VKDKNGYALAYVFAKETHSPSNELKLERLDVSYPNEAGAFFQPSLRLLAGVGVVLRPVCRWKGSAGS
jgi:hypothetical protein